jgi:DHA2 family multidrug resistance protein
VSLGQATLFTIYPRERHGYAMAIFSTGAMMGPIIGPIWHCRACRITS